MFKGDPKANEELKSEPKATNFPSYKLGDTDAQMIDQLSQAEAIGMILLLSIRFSDTLSHGQTIGIT